MDVDKSKTGITITGVGWHLLMVETNDLRGEEMASVALKNVDGIPVESSYPCGNLAGALSSVLSCLQSVMEIHRTLIFFWSAIVPLPSYIQHHNILDFLFNLVITSVEFSVLQYLGVCLEIFSTRLFIDFIDITWLESLKPVRMLMCVTSVRHKSVFITSIRRCNPLQTGLFRILMFSQLTEMNTSVPV